MRDALRSMEVCSPWEGCWAKRFAQHGLLQYSHMQLESLALF